MTDRDDRKSFRCAVADTCQQCQLRVGTATVSARLMDESAGGFAVLVEGLAGLEVEQVLHLRTNAGWFVVRIVHIAEVIPPDDDETPVNNETPWFRLGLLRVGEVEPTNESMFTSWTDGLRCHLGQCFPGSGMLMILGVLLAIIAVALPMELLTGLFHAAPSGVHDRATGSPANVSRPEKPLPNLAQPRSEESPSSSSSSDSSSSGPAFDNDSPFGADHGRTEKSSSSASAGKRWHETASRLPGASAFAMPEVVQELQLTDEQQTQIRQVIEATTQAIQALDGQLKGQQRQQIAQRRAQLFGQAQREALGVLTAEQRAQWQKLAEGQ